MSGEEGERTPKWRVEGGGRTTSWLLFVIHHLCADGGVIWVIFNARLWRLEEGDWISTCKNFNKAERYSMCVLERFFNSLGFLKLYLYLNCIDLCQQYMAL